MARKGVENAQRDGRGGDPKVDGFHLYEAGKFEVWLSDDDHALFAEHCASTELDAEREANALKRHFKRFAELGPTGFESDAFKSQGKRKHRHERIHVYGFKHHQYRIYGILTDRDGTQCFVGLSTDTSKKQNKAENGLLDKAAARADSWPRGKRERRK